MSDTSLNNLSPRAQQVLSLARKEANRFNNSFVGTEHLLLGIITLNQGVAVQVLRKLGLNLGTIRFEIEARVGVGPEGVMGNIPYTPRVRKVFSLAAKEAKAMKHDLVGTEHLLLGLLEEGDGVAAQVLKGVGLNDLKALRQEVLHELDPNHPALAEGAPKPADGVKPWPEVREIGDGLVRVLPLRIDSDTEPHGLRRLDRIWLFNFLELLISAGYDFSDITVDSIVGLIGRNVLLRELDVLCWIIEVSGKKPAFATELQGRYDQAMPGSDLERQIGCLFQRLTGQLPRKLGPPMDWLKDFGASGAPEQVTTPEDPTSTPPLTGTESAE